MYRTVDTTCAKVKKKLKPQPDQSDGYTAPAKYPGSGSKTQEETNKKIKISLHCKLVM